MRALFFFVLTCLLLASLSPADATVYKYVDENGRTVFVDGESRIPARYRGATTQVQTARPAVAEVSDETPSENGEKETDVKAEDTEPVEPPARTITDRAIEQRARQEVANLERARAYQTPIMVRGNRVLVPVELVAAGKSAHLMLLLDDAAPITTIHRSAVQELRFSAGEQINLPGSGNRAIKAEKVLAGLIDIGPFELKDYPVALVSPQGGSRTFDGTLGADFLKSHPYSVDFNREMLRWQQPGK